MKLTLKEWLLLAVGVAAIAVMIFSSMYDTVESKTNQMENTVSSTNLP